MLSIFRERLLKESVHGFGPGGVGGGAIERKQVGESGIKGEITGARLMEAAVVRKKLAEAGRDFVGSWVRPSGRAQATRGGKRARGRRV